MNLRKKVLWAAIVPFALGAFVLTGCGGSGGGGGTGSDEKYVAAICDAGLKFQNELLKLFTDIDDDASDEDVAKAFAKPLEEFAKGVSNARPPADMKAWHDQTVKALNASVSEIKKGNLDALDDDPIGDPPAAAAARLQKVAEKNKDCVDADFTFTDD